MLKGRDLCRVLRQRGAKKLFFHQRDTSTPPRWRQDLKWEGRGGGAALGFPRGLDLHLPNGNSPDQEGKITTADLLLWFRHTGDSRLYNNPAGQDDEVKPERSAASQSPPRTTLPETEREKHPKEENREAPAGPAGAGRPKTFHLRVFVYRVC